MEKKKWAGWIILTVIVLIAAVALTVTNALTEQPIANRNLTQAQEALRAIFPDADEGTKGFEEVSLATDSGLDFAYAVKKNGETIGYAGKVTVQGYGGLMEVTVGIDPEGTLKGVNVGGAEFKETEGLGSKAKEEPFLTQYIGKKPPLTVGENVDAIAGATITSRAVTDGVNSAAEKLTQLMGIVPRPGGVAEPTAKASHSANASVIGYGGPVLVELALDEAGAISALTVGAERFLETQGIGSKVKEEAFAQQFIGKKPPLTLNDIDAVSGATISSQAVVDAVNAAYAFLHE